MTAPLKGEDPLWAQSSCPPVTAVRQSSFLSTLRLANQEWQSQDPDQTRVLASGWLRVLHLNGVKEHCGVQHLALTAQWASLGHVTHVTGYRLAKSFACELFIRCFEVQGHIGWNTIDDNANLDRHDAGWLDTAKDKGTRVKFQPARQCSAIGHICHRWPRHSFSGKLRPILRGIWQSDTERSIGRPRNVNCGGHGIRTTPAVPCRRTTRWECICAAGARVSGRRIARS